MAMAPREENHMSLKPLAASALAATLLFGVAPAVAADLDYYGKQSGSPYDDPRYADIYGQPPGGYAPPPPPAYRPPPPYAPPPAAYPPPPHRPYADAAPGCMPRHMIRAQLEREGWMDFHAIEPREHLVVMNARRPNGEVYRLRIDRCTGAIASARLIVPVPQGPSYGYGPYADSPRPRWRRYY